MMINSFLLLVGFGVIATLLLIAILARLYVSWLHKVGPGTALLISHGNKVDVVTGGSVFVNHLTTRWQEISLELKSLDIAPSQILYTAQGVAVYVKAITQIKVRSDIESIRTAAELFLSKSQADRDNLIRLVMEGHLRRIVGQLTVKELINEPEKIEAGLIETATLDMERMGLQIISFTIKDVLEAFLERTQQESPIEQSIVESVIRHNGTQKE